MKQVLMILGGIFVLLVGSCAVLFAVGMTNLTSDEADALVEQTVQALVDRNAAELRSLMDERALSPELGAQIAHMMAVTPQGEVVRSRFVSGSRNADTVDGQLIQEFEIERRYEFDGGPATIRFHLIQDRNGARILGLNVNRGDGEDAPAAAEGAAPPVEIEQAPPVVETSPPPAPDAGKPAEEEPAPEPTGGKG